MKTCVYNAIPTAFLQTATIAGGQIQSTLPDAADHSEAIYAATWKGNEPFVTVLKGTPALVVAPPAGIPTVDKIKWIKDNPGQVLIGDANGNIIGAPDGTPITLGP